MDAPEVGAHTPWDTRLQARFCDDDTILRAFVVPGSSGRKRTCLWSFMFSVTVH